MCSMHTKNKYCFPFLQSFVCPNGNKRHSCGSKTALSPKRREHGVPSHTVCIVHAAKGNQAAPEITLWPLCIDQFLDMPCSILFQKVWTVSIVCCISLTSVFKCLHKCVWCCFNGSPPNIGISLFVFCFTAPGGWNSLWIHSIWNCWRPSPTRCALSSKCVSFCNSFRNFSYPVENIGNTATWIDVIFIYISSLW